MGFRSLAFKRWSDYEVKAFIRNCSYSTILRENPNPSKVRWHHRKMPYFILKTVSHQMLYTSYFSLLSYIFQLFKRFWYMNSTFLHHFYPFLTLETLPIYLPTHFQIYGLFNCDVNEILVYEVLVYEVINNKWMTHTCLYKYNMMILFNVIHMYICLGLITCLA